MPPEQATESAASESTMSQASAAESAPSGAILPQEQASAADSAADSAASESNETHKSISESSTSGAEVTNDSSLVNNQSPSADPSAIVFEYDFSDKVTVLPTPTAQKLPSEWKGFNLLYFFNTLNYKPVDEGKFRLISSLGFNFARIPIDYRCMISRGDWSAFNERALSELDKVVGYGIKYDIHLCINLHRAPGYTVATPPEPTDLWTQAEPRQAFCDMWRALAYRYKNIPNEYLSFNLVNEPPDIAEDTYANIMGAAAQAIWESNPDRVIIADGISWGAKPSKMVAKLGIAQATRGYQPFNLTHYKAEWVDGVEKLPKPSWPELMIPMYLYSYNRSDIRTVYDIEYDFSEAYLLDINVGVVSGKAKLAVTADGILIYARDFVSKAGTGEWKKEVYVPEWNVYQNIFDSDYRVEIPAGTKRVTVGIVEGDWLSVYDLKFSPAGNAGGTGKTFSITPNSSEWAAPIPPLKLDADGRPIVDESLLRDKKWLRGIYFKPWLDLMDSGCGVIIGEWGAYNKSPHDTVLSWMEDCLTIFRDAGIGWALWNFDDSFGPMNSGRADVDYEPFEGYRLDRKMLDLLQRYP